MIIVVCVAKGFQVERPHFLFWKEKKSSSASQCRRHEEFRLDGNKQRTSLFDTIHDVVSRQRRLIDDRAATMSSTRAIQGKTQSLPKVSLPLVIK